MYIFAKIKVGYFFPYIYIMGFIDISLLYKNSFIRTPSLKIAKYQERIKKISSLKFYFQSRFSFFFALHKLRIIWVQCLFRTNNVDQNIPALTKKNGVSNHLFLNSKELFINCHAHLFLHRKSVLWVKQEFFV